MIPYNNNINFNTSSNIKPMIENSRFGTSVLQRAAGGEKAAGAAGLNGLMRAGRKAAVLSNT